MYKNHKKIKRSRFSFVLLSGLAALSFFLLSCSTNSSATTKSGVKMVGLTPIPTASISDSLKNQGSTQLQAFQSWIGLMKQYGGDVTTYQQNYTTDEQELQNAQTTTQYTTALNTLNTQVNTIQIPAMKAEAQSLYNQLDSADKKFGTTHTFQDSYDGNTYDMGYEYNDTNGILGQLWAGSDLQSAATVSDYQTVIEELDMFTYNFNEMVKNYSDKTPADQAHKTDLDLLQYYGASSGKALVVSLSEQEIRVYDNGKLVKAIQATTGQPSLPSPPGDWHIESKETNVVFKSSAPKSSPDWYPDTKIAHAMQYHSNGYFIHEAWWRDEFGPGTQFPHQDPSDLEDSGNGSHGCINVELSNAAWIEDYVDIYTPVIVY